MSGGMLKQELLESILSVCCLGEIDEGYQRFANMAFVFPATSSFPGDFPWFVSWCFWLIEL